MRQRLPAVLLQQRLLSWMLPASWGALLTALAAEPIRVKVFAGLSCSDKARLQVTCVACKNHLNSPDSWGALVLDVRTLQCEGSRHLSGSRKVYSSRDKTGYKGMDICIRILQLSR